MEHEHARHSHRYGRAQTPPSLNRTALAATWHCLTGCAIGEVLGLVIATALGWGNAASIAIAVVLAFFFGYSLTLRPFAAACPCVRRHVSPWLPTPSRSG
jgi:cation transporter-like permease